ncbi:hypothetical protein ACF0C8_02575 [Pseudomonas aeruginosa]|uniref:hypothetical protein n=4 Tax=Pseudomonas TaxID=286 RepID=UPI000FC40775|nr:hypothetical protein [Pseudomonas aeruginosa]ELC0876091.1 hypothetical protein [Pseudomonas aeruginosa]ELF7085899.1 hypothetical protein [Pseudomonas aeruginosa]ELF7092254.1 hypothetical protein [Pseudomonas aeruginosa]ELG8229933.1 hypothetical protein [Pseudomonas aeruginosa]ELI0479397.1 hypothetical protein [Pseudomonas aeruginosa]
MTGRGRPFVFPRADDRSPSDPHTFCPRKSIIGLYNQAHGTSRKHMSLEIERWFEAEARHQNWIDVRFSDDGATLTAHLVHARGIEPQAAENDPQADNVMPLIRRRHPL